MVGLTGIERAWQAGFDIAEGASARAGIAHDHEGGVLRLPALTNIWTAGLFAHGMQIVFANDPAGLEIARGNRRLDTNPIGFRQDRLIRPMRLFRMPRPARLGNGVDQYSHGRTGSLGISLRGQSARKRYLRLWLGCRKPLPLPSNR
jgi:hypothetical protein